MCKVLDLMEFTSGFKKKKNNLRIGKKFDN
jgi:hypothetical protein